MGGEGGVLPSLEEGGVEGGGEGWVEGGGEGWVEGGGEGWVEGKVGWRGRLGGGEGGVEGKVGWRGRLGGGEGWVGGEGGVEGKVGWRGGGEGGTFLGWSPPPQGGDYLAIFWPLGMYGGYCEGGGGLLLC